ncbi:AhpD family alkylhydroperoxidase [Nocardioides albertanoniae]|uniref:AhpD family alkylhydroperoxidase n=1 Tax=Nocardioides albertanoniae TaxID=1175486 RepID=A0A543A2D8_9ACTN|nr:carboxymuconolactone decarboxylase family protein [Nocardioides albertanoniae]TQL66753.1 AhpD family alkylhydroperoxidase [Nocardioides albertanoniae]
MSNRMKNPIEVIPQSLKGVGNLIAAVTEGGLPETTTELVAIRVSQINGCAACLQGHYTRLDAIGLSIQKVIGVAAFRESPFFDEAEKAALALAEAVTRLADADDAVPDELWREVTKHYDEKQTAALVLCIATHNLFNRVNVTVREDPSTAKWAG